MRLQNFLNEKTFNINADVDYVYKLGFKKVLDVYKKKSLIEFVEFIYKNYPTSTGDRTFYTINSGMLKSRQCKKADEENPIMIYCGLYPYSSYIPEEKVIRIALHKGAFGLFSYNADWDQVKRDVPNKAQFERLEHEFTPTNVKGAIYHELSHWLNDTLHNKHITNKLNKSVEMDDRKFLLGKHTNVNFTDFEVDAQIHAIKQIKRDNKKKYDKFTWKDLFTRKPALQGVWQELVKVLEDKRMKFFQKYSKNRATQGIWDKIEKKELKVQKDFFKDFTKRLNREGLLVKGLTKFPTAKELL